jgi:hypothetical protein
MLSWLSAVLSTAHCSELQLNLFEYPHNGLASAETILVVPTLRNLNLIVSYYKLYNLLYHECDVFFSDEYLGEIEVYGYEHCWVS